jgi:hypothetical protein
VDLRITLGPVPDSLPEQKQGGLYMRIAPDQRILFTVPGIANYLIDTPDHVIIAPAQGADPWDISTFFMGSVFAMLCHLRGLRPLHSSAVEVNGKALVFVGQPRAGKSTLAAALVGAGFRLLADDVSIVSLATETPSVRPYTNIQKLWSDSAQALGLAAGRPLRTGTDGVWKYEYRSAAQSSAPLPLGALFHLQRAQPPGQTRIERLAPLCAFQAVWGNIYRDHAARCLGLTEQMFLDCGKISQSIPCLSLHRSDAYDDLPSLIDQITTTSW